MLSMALRYLWGLNVVKNPAQSGFTCLVLWSGVIVPKKPNTVLLLKKYVPALLSRMQIYKIMLSPRNKFS